jgi:hypothetical protein
MRNPRPRSQYPKAIILFILLGLLLVPRLSQLRAQSFDYEKHPRLDFNYNSLELDLGFQPENLRFDGAARYSIKANVSGADTVIFYAAHMDISSVSVDDNQADYMLHNDSLFVPLNQPAKRGQAYQVNIRYSGSPVFGLLKNSNGTVWTSQLPKTQRHWVPIVDNPNVTLKTTFNISVPSGFGVWATGRKTGEEVVSVDAMTYHFASEKEVPASSLSFAIGRFNHDSINSGGQQINLAVEQNMGDEVNSDQLLQSAQDYLGKISDSLGIDYPYDQLTILVMEDHAWETKSWGASTVYLYQNRGAWQPQLMRGIIAQWFGVYQREAQWSQGDAINLYQAILQQSFETADSLLVIEDEPRDAGSSVYNTFGPAGWNSWQNGLNQWQSESIREIISEQKDTVLAKLPPVIDWEDYAEHWYQKSGQTIFEVSQPGVVTKSKSDTTEPAAQETPDSVAYQVVYDLNEEDNQLKLTFSATHGMYTDLTSIDVTQIYSEREETGEVTFTGEQDSLILQVEPTIRTVRLEAREKANLHLDEIKPASFLIYELRNAETAEQRAQAARKLGAHSDNPDLQLAIRDFLRSEIDPKVRAALLSSLADITQGADGTEETFLDATKSDNRLMRNAALMALQYYKDNPTVFSRVENMALNGDLEMFKNATKVLTAIASPDQFQRFVENVTQQDTTGQRSVFVIQQLANLEQINQAVKMATLFIDDDQSYDIRRTALGILIQHDHTPTDWLTRADQLLADSDPRIRYLTILGLQRNLNPKVTEYLKEYIQDEYDQRVHQKIEQLIQ